MSFGPGRKNQTGRNAMSGGKPVSDVYEQFMGRWSARLADPFLSFAGVQAGQCVLDVGCGTGVIPEFSYRRGVERGAWAERASV
jgi:2-polyprenyl-3-methyl-5-hydroxy-6-metoxy-1,4-benzoquinol methylase